MIKSNNIFSRQKCYGFYIFVLLFFISIFGCLSSGSENIFEEYKNYYMAAVDVLNGKYGNGSERYRRLQSDGFNADMVQNIVNDFFDSASQDEFSNRYCLVSTINQAAPDGYQFFIIGSGKTFPEPDHFSLAGFDFAGWYSDEGRTASFDFSNEINENIVIYAGWKEEETDPEKNFFKVDFINQFGDDPESRSIEEGNLITAPEIENSYPGYVFSNKWKYGNEDNFWDFSKDVITSDMVLEAYWVPINYSVIFDPNGGDGDIEKQNFPYDISSELKKNPFTKNNYHFTGWNTKKDGSGQDFTDGQSVKNLSNISGDEIILYAQWLPDFVMLEGEGSIYVLHSGKTVTFRCSGDYEAFLRIDIDGENISNDNFSVWKGSTGVTLLSEYLDTLDEGDHLISIIFSGGSCEGKFSVISPADVQNGLPAFIIIIIAVIIAAVTTFIFLKNKNKTGDE